MLPSLPAYSYTQGYRLGHIRVSCDWAPLLTRLVPNCLLSLALTSPPYRTPFVTAAIKRVRHRWTLSCKSCCWIQPRPLSQRRESRESGFRALWSLSHRETSFRRDPPPFSRSVPEISGGLIMNALLALITEPPSGHSAMHLDYQMQHALALGLSSHGQEQQGYHLAGIARDLGRSCMTGRQEARSGRQISVRV